MQSENFFHRRAYRPFRWLASALLISSVLSACGGGSSSTDNNPPPAPPKLAGQTSFVSASPTLSNTGFVSTFNATATFQSTKSDSTRTAHEGDIFRVLENGKTILNANRYRGLQIIDISDVSKPSIIGKANVIGSPVEMYRVDNLVYLLLNEYKSYQRIMVEGKESLDAFNGAAVVTLDISQITAPRIISATRVPGYIQTSRMTSGNGKNALYLTASEYYNYTAGGLTKAFSYALSAQGATEKSVLDLGGHMQAIAATGDRLLVARNPDWSRAIGSKVAIIDISSPEGVMQQGADVQVAGWVRNKNNLHIAGNILRVVSGALPGFMLPNLPPVTNNDAATAINTNHIQTFDISDIKQAKARDHKTFGLNQNLFATTFMEDRAFFVTYLRVDPFHAFSISPTGMLNEENEFVVSGWNDFFKPVHNNSRLIGIGHNDENNRRVIAVSLYDSSNLKNRNPLIVRANTDLENTWSAASWDDRAFSVLENATNVLAADGKTVETGLVLLPYSAYDAIKGQSLNGVQTFSFSNNTLTRRGTMSHSDPVSRTFLAQSALAANLSDRFLSLFDTKNPNQPVHRASLSLTQSYSQLVPFARFAARLNYGVIGETPSTTRDMVEFVNFDNANSRDILGKLEVPVGSQIYNVGEKLVVVHKKYAETNQHIEVAVWDISNPAQAVLMGKTAVTDAQDSLPHNLISTDMKLGATLLPYPSMSDAQVVGDALVFVKNNWMPIYANSKSPFVTDFTVKLSLSIVDLSNPAAPQFQPNIALDDKQHSVGVVANGKHLWLNYKVAAEPDTTQLPQAKYFVKRLDLSTPSKPLLSREINIPGQLMAVTGDQLYTKDFHWTKVHGIDNSINVLTVQDDLAYRQVSHMLTNQIVTSLHVDAGNIFVSWVDGTYSGKGQVSLFTRQNNTLATKSTIVMPDWSTLDQVQGNKVLLNVSGGFLLYDFTPSNPVPQAFFNTAGWASTSVVFGTKIFVPAFDYGIYQFDFDTVNLNKPGI